MISKQDLENIKKEADKEFEKLNQILKDMDNLQNSAEKEDKPNDETDKNN